MSPDNDQHVLDELTAQTSSLFAKPVVSDAYMRLFRQSAEEEAEARDLSQAPSTVQRVAAACTELALGKCSRLYHVESDYYDWSLQKRAFRLVAPSRHHLCKTILFENTHWKQSNELDPLNARYYCVLAQYTAKPNTQRLLEFVRSLSGGVISKKQYNFRLASAEKSLELTGHGMNGVCPLGMLTNIPIVMSEAITKLLPPVFWLGAGNVDWKLAIPVADFISATKCFITDIA